MGINHSTWRLLTMLRRLKAVDFSETATLGRQEFGISPSDLPSGSIPAGLSWKVGDFAEPLFRSLGANTVDSFDASDYEGATHVHDFNRPVAANHRDKYSFLLDGGSLEHILNPAQVIGNHNAILKTGGHVVIASNCNGDPAHGLFQFSPEFFYSVLCPANGFADARVILHDRDRDMWHMVRSPSELGRRNNIPNARFFIIGIARKISTAMEIVAQQSDYEAAWRTGLGGKQEKPRPSHWFYRFHNKTYGRFLDEAPRFIPETLAML